jgi:hypothetical protein
MIPEEIKAIIEKTDKSFTSHRGRPGKRGGSLPKNSISVASERGSKIPQTEADRDLYSVMDKTNVMISNNFPKDTGMKYKGNYDMVLKEGSFFEVQERPKKIKQGEMKQCYTNAGRLALDDDNYTYCEGFASTKQFGIPFAHAWCIDKQGKVVDPTWKDGASYFGIKFSTDFLKQTILKTKTWGLIPDYPSKKYNPMKEGFSKDAIVKSYRKINFNEISEKEKDRKRYNYIEDSVVKILQKTIKEKVSENINELKWEKYIKRNEPFEKRIEIAFTELLKEQAEEIFSQLDEIAIQRVEKDMQF